MKKSMLLFISLFLNFQMLQASVERSVTLNTGYNAVQFDANVTLEYLVEKVGFENLISLQGDGQGSAYKKEYVDNGTPFLNSFTETAFGKAYWINVVHDVTFSYQADVYVNNKSIDLTTGWNFVGASLSLTLTEIKEQFGADNLLVIQGAGQEQSYKKEYEDNGTPFLNSFISFEVGKGYWLKVVNPVALTFAFEISISKPWEHGKLKVSDDGHMLQHEDGTGFFWMADTIWFMHSKMSREEIDRYLTDRASKGFTVIMTNIMSRVWRKNFYGDIPYPVVWPSTWPPTDEDKKPFKIDQFITTPGNSIDNAEEYDYWDHVDYAINKAAEKGMYLALTLTWRDFTIDYIARDETLYTNYTKWLAKRYKDTPNIFWLNGGDVYNGYDKDGEDIKRYEVWDWIGEAIRSEDSNHLISFHGAPSSDAHHDKAWLDFNMIESGHWVDSLRQNAEITRDYNKLPVKPVVDAETRYEEIESYTGYKITTFDVREIAYYQVFAGAFGHTYGHNSIWQVAIQEEVDRGGSETYAPMSSWQEALNAPGAYQMQYISQLMQSRPILGRVPDQALIVGGDTGKFRATRGDGYAFIYSTSGQTIEIAMGKISGDKVNIWSYNPRTGEAKALKSGFSNSGIYTFTPEGIQEFGNDWVIVIDDASKGYEKP